MHSIIFDSRDAASSYALMLSGKKGVHSVRVIGSTVVWSGRYYFLED